MSAEFYPRRNNDHIWRDGGDRYPFQKGVASLEGVEHHSTGWLDTRLHDQFYKEQAAAMRRANPALVQGGNDVQWTDAADFVTPSMEDEIMPDPVGLDFRLPSEMQEFVDRKQAINMQPESAPFTQHPEYKLRMHVTPRATAADLTHAASVAATDDFEFEADPASQAEYEERVQAAQSAGDFRDPAFKGPSKASMVQRVRNALTGKPNIDLNARANP